MASHHHHHLHQCQNLVPTTTNSCCGCCYNHCCSQPNHPPPPPSPLQQSPIDPLLQILATLIQQQQQQQQRKPNVYSPHHSKHHARKNHHQSPCFEPHKLHFNQDGPQQRILASLLRRINTLESFLHHFSASSADYGHPSLSLRDTAARVIQTHFRIFLARRSRTLRQLKELAFIKTTFNSLKSSVSKKTDLDFHAISHKVRNLLLKLDSIQCGDPMIRDGKISVSRDLVRFLEFIDGLAVKRHELLHKSGRNVRFVGNSNKSRVLKGNDVRSALGGNQKEILENLRDRVEKIIGFSRVCENDKEHMEFEGFQQFIDDDEEEEEDPKGSMGGNCAISKIRNGVLVNRHSAQPRVKKSVSFVENENVYGTSHESISSREGSFSDGSDSSGDHGDFMENQYEGIKEALLENGGSAEIGDGERNARRNLRNNVDYEINSSCLDQHGSLVFSAPLPVQMESRGDLMKRKDVKIIKYGAAY